jgi:hypothetical protein
LQTGQSVADDQAAPSARNRLNSLYKLKFSPESVIRRLDLPLDMAMSFLQFNYLGIFEQMESKQNTPEDSLPLDPSRPQPSYDSLERAERLSEMLSEADMLYTCQFSTNLPIDRAASSSFPKEYVESICSRAPSCSMYPTSKTSHLFESFNESLRHTELSLCHAGVADKNPTAISHGYDHLTGTHGGVTLKKSSSTNSNASSSSSSSGGRFGLSAIRRPTSLDVK